MDSLHSLQLFHIICHVMYSGRYNRSLLTNDTAIRRKAKSDNSTSHFYRAKIILLSGIFSRLMGGPNTRASEQLVV